MNTRSIISLLQMSQTDNTKKLAQGALNNTVKRFDLLTGKVSTTQYVNSEQEQNFKYASPKPLSLNTLSYNNKYGNTISTALLIPHSSDLPENFIDSMLGFRRAFVTKMGQNIYRMYVNGDPALTAGDIITVNVPSSQGSTGAPYDNRLYAGNYLISKLRHIILNNVPNPKSYTCSMELIKGFQEDFS